MSLETLFSGLYPRLLYQSNCQLTRTGTELPLESTVRAFRSTLRGRDDVDVDGQRGTFSGTPTQLHTEKLCCSFLMDNGLTVNWFRQGSMAGDNDTC